MTTNYWVARDDCRIEDFAAAVECRTAAADYPLASEVLRNVPIYDSDGVRHMLAEPTPRDALYAEWGRALLDGPGIVVLRSAYADLDAVNAASRCFEALIEEQRANPGSGGDHFAKPGANDRIWNALQKFCLREPEVFAAYHGNQAIAAISEAWLGPGYQMTSQVNVVNPGGEAQSPHRDYHLGFQTPEVAERYPLHVHRLSPVLTLQGAVAHCDMPVETGPTLYLPYSQTYAAGYLAWPRPEFRAYFEAHHVQLPLAKGDAVFFNPALFHAAGSNRTTHVRRMANLLQVSSAYGRAMESVDRARMSSALYPALLRLRAEGRLDPAQCDAAIASCAEGYAFPTNLDRDPPLGGLAPPSQQDLMRQALREGWAPARFDEAIEAQRWRRMA